MARLTIVQCDRCMRRTEMQFAASDIPVNWSMLHNYAGNVAYVLCDECLHAFTQFMQEIEKAARPE